MVVEASRAVTFILAISHCRDTARIGGACPSRLQDGKEGTETEELGSPTWPSRAIEGHCRPRWEQQTASLFGKVWPGTPWEGTTFGWLLILLVVSGCLWGQFKQQKRIEDGDRVNWDSMPLIETIQVTSEFDQLAVFFWKSRVAAYGGCRSTRNQFHVPGGSARASFLVPRVPWSVVPCSRASTAPKTASTPIKAQ